MWPARQRELIHTLEENPQALKLAGPLVSIQAAVEDELLLAQESIFDGGLACLRFPSKCERMRVPRKARFSENPHTVGIDIARHDPRFAPDPVFMMLNLHVAKIVTSVASVDYLRGNRPASICVA
jgi:hypothetical protein